MSKLRAVVWVAVSSKRQAEDDKISLAYQEEVARAWCAAHGYDVLEVLEVKGHSRSDPNLIRLLELYRTKGVMAYERLQQLWAAKGFDVLVAYSSDRLGRSGALIHWVIETTYYEGMQVCLTDGGGLMDASNYRMQTLLGTAQATMPMDAFRDKTRQTKLKLAAEGLSTGRWPMSHLPVRDPVSGKAIDVIVNEAHRPLYEAIADLLLEGVAWNKMGERLQRDGWLTGADTYYHGKNIRRMFLLPWVFGNSVVRHNRGPANWMNGRWIFDRDVPTPPDVVVYYDVVPPMFEGERLEQIKAELRRRFDITGRGSSRDAHRFSRLCLCDDCGYLMSVRTKVVDGIRRRNGYQCGHSTAGMPPDKRCPNRLHIHTGVIQAFVEAQLNRYLRLAEGQPLENVSLPVSAVATLTQQIERVTGQLNRAIDLQLAEVDNPTLAARYQARARELNQEIQHLEAERAQAQAQEEAQTRRVEAQVSTIAYIREVGVERFWQLPDPTINQWLLRFFGDLRISIRGKSVVGLKRRTTKGWR